MDQDKESGRWNLDKRVPIATLIAIMTQALALGWMASSMDGRLSALEAYTQEIRASRFRERLAVEESRSYDTNDKFKVIDAKLQRIDDKLDRLVDKLDGSRGK